MKGAVLAMVAAAVVAPAAMAGKPEFERIDIDESFQDEFLSEACGFDVITTAIGHITVRRFDRERGAVEVRTVSVRLTATADDRTYRFNDAGGDFTHVDRDGNAVLAIVGQVPFDFNGIIRIDLETEEVIFEGGKSTVDELEKACEALSA